MKLYCLCLCLLLPLFSHAYPATSSTAADKSLSLEDIDLDNEQGKSVKDSQIAKRSGSFDYVAHLKSGLLSSIGGASASIASGSSGSSSGGGGGETHHHDVVVHGNSVDYDPWSFKKSVLNTIFQAVKAITGGVTALKGQLIKGSGYALSASGNLVAASGDKVTDVGKSIINSAHVNSHTYATSHSSGGGSGFIHPFAKLSSLSGASSGGSSGSSGSSGNKHSSSAPGPVLHHETITTYEIPTGHSNYGPPSKPPTFSSATHQYLPPGGSNYGGVSGSAGAPFTIGHAAFEAPQSNYLPSAYGQDVTTAGTDDFNIYGRHKKLSDEEARRAALQLQEILSMLPNGKTEYTASKTVALNTNSGSDDSNVEQADLYNSYGVPLPNNLGPLESLSHTESITAAYGPSSQGPADIYHQMAKRPQTAEEAYIQKHPNEGYDYPPAAAGPPPPPAAPSNNEYKVDNYHASKSNALKDLSPIIAALEVAKRKGPNASNSNAPVTYSIEKQVHKQVAPFQYLPPVVQKTKYTYSAPPPPRPAYSGGYKVRRHVAARRPSLSRAQDYDIQDPLMFNRLLEV
ncbi:uncharacterized protein LOC6572956 isoform X1 [Drosophila mojavensis]|uniref:DUF4766 domain-containing protein n=1 Tax=Drosophila mojavensis TaxID=7230 RepID=B4K9P5_DROMO|nr:uncharacterized protein LOC6572956 isoform X1 [Drosophila mojavensis]EDW14520.1 uncharacterized protein Dmoj_GI24304 [Drosophila mojavensis]